MNATTNNVLKVFQCSDSEWYAATSAEQAADLFEEMTDEKPDEGYPVELTDADLDEPLPAFDEDECPTGEMTSIRQMLAEHGDEPGRLCGSDY